MTKSNRVFASISRKERQRVSAKGGRASHGSQGGSRQSATGNRGLAFADQKSRERVARLEGEVIGRENR